MENKKEKEQILEELTTISKFGHVGLSTKGKKLLKNNPSALKDLFSQAETHVVKILPRARMWGKKIYLDLKKIEPLLNIMSGTIKIDLPKDIEVVLYNSNSFLRDLKADKFVIDGGRIDVRRYCICEAYSLKEIELIGVEHLGHCACAKNINCKKLILTPGKNKKIYLEGQLYKPADETDINKYEEIEMEVPILSNSPFIYVDPRECPSISVQNRIYYDFSDLALEKGLLEISTTTNYKVNPNSKFTLAIKDADSYINETDYESKVKSRTKNITNKTFAQLLGIGKSKIKTIKMKDIFNSCADVLINENQIACNEQILTARRITEDQEAFDWHKQQREQDMNAREKFNK